MILGGGKRGRATDDAPSVIFKPEVADGDIQIVVNAINTASIDYDEWLGKLPVDKLTETLNHK